MELTAVIPDEQLTTVAAQVSAELALPAGRLVNLLAGRLGRITKPTTLDKATMLADALVRAGVSARAIEADEADALLLSSSGWPSVTPSRREAPAGGAWPSAVGGERAAAKVAPAEPAPERLREPDEVILVEEDEGEPREQQPADEWQDEDWDIEEGAASRAEVHGARPLDRPRPDAKAKHAAGEHAEGPPAEAGIATLAPRSGAAAGRPVVTDAATDAVTAAEAQAETERVAPPTWTTDDWETEAWDDEARYGQEFTLAGGSSGRGGTAVSVRRVVMAIALLVALGVFVLLNLPGVGLGDRFGSVGSGYEAGLEAYRQGEFGSAWRAWLPVAEAGDARAQYMLGYMSEHGLGRPWSNAQAAAWYRQAAEQGLPEAQFALAQLYARGMGVPFDEVQALFWLRQAAEGGLPEAEYQLGLMLFHGRGTERNFAEAMLWFQRAARDGVPEAASYVAFLEWQLGPDITVGAPEQP